MDTKALAKSKRAHSLQHKKKHQTHQGLKAPSVASDDKKIAGKQAKERPEKSHGQQTKERTPLYQGSRALPSNWDRYNEGFDTTSEGAQASSSQLTEFVMPKSKGADYAHLISEAKAQSQSRYSSDVSPLFDDFISDFTQDFGPMLAAKGQSMLSWITDDSFEFESKANNGPEAPFLSLNLNALAEQLAKAKLSERLYLQSDLLPLELELLDEEHGKDKHDYQTRTTTAETNISSSSLTNDQALTVIQTCKEQSNPLRKITDDVSQLREINRSIWSNQDSEHPTHSGSTFEAASAEAELDKLLNSFSSAVIPEPSLTRIASAADASDKSKNRGSHVDNAIDILLEETSCLTVVEQQILEPKSDTESFTSAKNHITKSEIVDDFDSWLDTI